jgi:NADPH:quinone reductase-like Zn-dependent oxidoreductase
MGVIESLGEGVTGMAPGDRVTSLGWDATAGGEGSWQELVVLPAERVVRLPDAVSDEAGAQFYVRSEVPGRMYIVYILPPPHLMCMFTSFF